MYTIARSSWGAALLSCAALLYWTPPATAADEVVSVENWRVREGDDPRWSAPDFDDSDWTPSSWPRRSRNTLEVFIAGTRWYRGSASIQASLAGRRLAIAIDMLDEVYDVFVDGVRVGTHGSWEPAPVGKFPALRWFPLPETAARAPTVHVAIRRWTGPARTNYTSFISISAGRHAPEIGPAEVIRLGQELRWASGLNAHMKAVAVNALTLLAGLLSLALYLARQGSRENRWLGLALLCDAAAPLTGMLVALSDLPLRSPIAAAVAGLQYFDLALWPFFLASIYPRFATPLRWLAAASGLVAVGVAVSYSGLAPVPYVFQQSAPWAAMISAGAVAIALLAERRGVDTALLAATLLLQAVMQIWATQLSAWLGFADQARLLRVGALVIDPRIVARLLFAVTALAILYRRHRREQERQAGLDRELAAARLVQESLLAGQKAAVTDSSARGFAVEAAYFPASEVGGDFYHELPGADGSLLVLVGDVSGKGMRAALLVGHISGALSNERSRRPAEVLANLNQSLLGRVSGGFVTCCCARFDADGRVTAANAGHLAPYVRGREVEVEAGLPLGVVSGVEYAESSVALDGQFVLLSDGVVEAANAKGELFGFDRTREISAKSAQEIAEAARAWGQNDDITVVTVRRSA